MPSRPGFVLTISLLLILQSLLRLLFYYEAVYVGVPLLQPQPPANIMNLINSLNLLLGILGLIVVPGLFSMKGWGYWGTLAVSVTSILFDGWASITVASTALAGLILPVIFLLVLISRRSSFSKDRQKVGTGATTRTEN